MHEDHAQLSTPTRKFYLDGSERDALHMTARDLMALVAGEGSPGTGDARLTGELRLLLSELGDRPATPVEVTIASASMGRLLISLSERAALHGRLDGHTPIVLAAADRILGEMKPLNVPCSRTGGRN